MMHPPSQLFGFGPNVAIRDARRWTCHWAADHAMLIGHVLRGPIGLSRIKKLPFFLPKSSERRYAA